VSCEQQSARFFSFLFFRVTIFVRVSARVPVATATATQHDRLYAFSLHTHEKSFMMGPTYLPVSEPKLQLNFVYFPSAFPKCQLSEVSDGAFLLELCEDIDAGLPHCRDLASRFDDFVWSEILPDVAPDEADFNERLGAH